MFKKNAAVEIQFSWVFIIIAGTVLLMFFIKIAGDYKSVSEKEIAMDTVEKISTIASTGQASSRSSSVVEIEGLELRTGCDPNLCTAGGCPTDFDFQGQGISAPEWMELEPIFASTKIRGDELILWSQEWAAPYKVSNFLYLTSGDHRFVFVYNDDSQDLAMQVYDKFSENEYVESEIINEDDIQDIKYQGEAQTKFVFSYKPEPFSLDESFEKRSWDAVFFEGDADTGTVYFSEDKEDGKRPGESHYYYGLPMLMGAIYSDDINHYKCNFRKANLKLIRMNNIYYNRAKLLENDFKDTNCETFYGPGLTTEIKEINETINSSFEIEGRDNLKESEEEIAQINYDAKQGGCARVY